MSDTENTGAVAEESEVDVEALGLPPKMDLKVDISRIEEVDFDGLTLVDNETFNVTELHLCHYIVHQLGL